MYSIPPLKRARKACARRGRTAAHEVVKVAVRSILHVSSGPTICAAPPGRTRPVHRSPTYARKAAPRRDGPPHGAAALAVIRRPLLTRRRCHSMPEFEQTSNAIARDDCRASIWAWERFLWSQWRRR